MRLWGRSLGETMEYTFTLSLCLFPCSVILSPLVSFSLFHLCFRMLWPGSWWGEGTNDTGDSRPSLGWYSIDPRLPSGWKVKASMCGFIQSILTNGKKHTRPRKSARGWAGTLTSAQGLPTSCSISFGIRVTHSDDSSLLWYWLIHHSDQSEQYL